MGRIDCLGHFNVTTDRLNVCGLGRRSWYRHSRIRIHQARRAIARKVVRLILGIVAGAARFLEHSIHRNGRSIMLILRVQWRVASTSECKRILWL